MKPAGKSMWSNKPPYKVSIVSVSFILLIGFILQYCLGKFDFTLLQAPVNLIAGLCIIVFLAGFSIFRKSTIYQWFSGVPFSVILIATLLILGFLMGIIPQSTNQTSVDPPFFVRLGFKHITSSWPFVLVYFVMLLSLGALIIRRLLAFKWQDYAFYLNHIGLWIILFAAGLGTADRAKYMMYVQKGKINWHAFTEDKKVVNMPFAIRLNRFDIEEYRPEIAIINHHTGVPQPENKPQFYQIDTKQPFAQISGWSIKVNQFIDRALSDSISGKYTVTNRQIATAAANLTVTSDKNKQPIKGWVAAGNSVQHFKVLPLDSDYCVIMLPPKPKRFLSDIHVFKKDGTFEHAILEVNKPLKIDNWSIYQFGYNQAQGRLSTFSSIQFVYDPWLHTFYIGVLLFALGSVCLIVTGKKKKKNNDNME